MIEVRVETVNGVIHEMLITGHGGAEKGKDLVCAGVSSCLIGALNALDHAENYSLEIRSGYSHIKEIAPTQSHDQVVLETLFVQLKTIAESYPDRCKVQISRKEGTK